LLRQTRVARDLGGASPTPRLLRLVLRRNRVRLHGHTSLADYAFHSRSTSPDGVFGPQRRSGSVYHAPADVSGARDPTRLVAVRASRCGGVLWSRDVLRRCRPDPLDFPYMSMREIVPSATWPAARCASRSLFEAGVGRSTAPPSNGRPGCGGRSGASRTSG